MKLSYQRWDSDRLRQVTTLAAIVGSIAVNTWSNIFPLNGASVGKLANTEFAPVQIIPASYAFGIWGLIYLGLIAFGLYQFQPPQRHNPRLQRGGYLLVFASVAQCAWIYLFMARLFPLSVLAMLGILLPLINLYQRLGIGQQTVPRREQKFIHLPISIYLAWISVATVVNVAVMLYSGNWNGWGIAPIGWTLIMMTITAALATLITLKRGDLAYTRVIIWALIAIGIRQLTMPLVGVTAVVLAIALTIITLRIGLKPRPKTLQRMENRL